MYGGEEHLEAPPKELLLAQTENYVEYSRTGRIVKGQEKAVMKSKYEEDVYPSNHTSVWGSYWHEGRNPPSFCLTEQQLAAFPKFATRTKISKLPNKEKVVKLVMTYSGRTQTSHFQRDTDLHAIDDVPDVSEILETLKKRHESGKTLISILATLVMRSYDRSTEVSKISKEGMFQQLTTIRQEVLEILRLLHAINEDGEGATQILLSTKEDNIKLKLKVAIDLYEKLRNDMKEEILKLTGEAESSKVISWFTGSSIALVGIEGLRQLSNRQIALFPVLFIISAGLYRYIFGSSDKSRHVTTSHDKSTEAVAKARQLVLEGERALREALMEVNTSYTDCNLIV
ncbi:Pre-mRNA-splicing factor SLU7 [Exaiptasia diaphana]|nr:Pre-mRNA-splicing factor SLU7 [Exaiptasia diaphana]